jgi:Outer membrane lipoprotein-sorting protein
VLAVLILLSTCTQQVGAQGSVVLAANNDAKLVGFTSGVTRQGEEKEEATAFVNKMSNAADALKTYSFKFTMKVYKKKKTVVEKGNFYFKKPRLIRIEETGSYKKGAVAVLTANGRVKARLGGALKFFVADLPARSKTLLSANGYPMVESDYVSLTTALKDFLKDGVSAQVTSKPIRFDGVNEPVYLLEMNKSGKLWKKVAVSAKTTLPLQWWDYADSGTLWSYSSWTDFKTDKQLADSLFNLKGVPVSEALAEQHAPKSDD